MGSAGGHAQHAEAGDQNQRPAAQRDRQQGQDGKALAARLGGGPVTGMPVVDPEAWIDRLGGSTRDVGYAAVPFLRVS